MRGHTDFEAELLVCGYFDVLILGLFQMRCDPISHFRLEASKVEALGTVVISEIVVAEIE